MTTPRQSIPIAAGDGMGLEPLLFNHQIQREKIRLNVTNTSEYERVTSPTATQRIFFWDWLDGLGYEKGGTNSGVGAPDRLLIGASSGTVTASLTADATTGKTHFQVSPGTAAAVTGSLVKGAALEGGSTRSTFRAAENPWFKCLVLQNTAPVGGTQDYYLGFRLNNSTGLQDGIYFRSTNAGAWTLVCRNASVESTLALPESPTTTLVLLELRVERDGSEVVAYFNNARVGSITTNIPTALLIMVAMHDNRAVTITTGGIFWMLGWGYARDVIA